MMAQVSHSTGPERAQVDATSLFPRRIVQHRHQGTPRGFSSSGAVSLRLLISYALGSGVVGREASSSMKSLVWVTGGILHLCFSPVLAPEHLPQTRRGCRAAVGAQGRAAQPNVSLLGLLLLLHPDSPCRVTLP